MKIIGKVAIITGASSGIGRALAVELGLRGARIVAAARGASKLSETSALLGAYGIAHIVVPCDVISQSSIENLLAAAKAEYSAIDIFVNNAGIGLFETTAGSDPQDVEAVFKANFFGPLAIMRAVVPLLNGGILVNISSAAAKYAPYRQGIYAASKAALDRITEAVALEEESHMKTLLVVPDRTATPFMQHVVGPRDNVKLGLKLKAATSEHVAFVTAQAIEKEKSLCYTTPKSHIYAILSALAPSFVKYVTRKTI